MAKSYKQSKHKWTYIRIAWKHFTSPSKVYELAHGAEYDSKDRAILHDLAKAKIVRHIDRDDE